MADQVSRIAAKMIRAALRNPEHSVFPDEFVDEHTDEFDAVCIKINPLFDYSRADGTRKRHLFTLNRLVFSDYASELRVREGTEEELAERLSAWKGIGRS